MRRAGPILTSIESEVAKTLCKAVGFCLTDFNLNSREKRSLSARNEAYLTDSFFFISIVLHVICTMEFEPAREDCHLFRVLQNQASEKDDFTAFSHIYSVVILCKLEQSFSTRDHDACFDTFIAVCLESLITCNELRRCKS